MPGLRLQWKAESMAAVTHLASLGVKIRETALWGFYSSLRSGAVTIHTRTDTAYAQKENVYEKKNPGVYSSDWQLPAEDGL